MIIELLQTLSMEDQDSQTPECLSTVLCSFLHARDKVSEIITSFSDDIVCCSPLDNMISLPSRNILPESRTSGV